jgi:hypothetical protein
MVKFKEVEEIPPELETIHNEMEKEFRSWAEKHGFVIPYVPRVKDAFLVGNWIVQVFRTHNLQLRFRLEKPLVGPPERPILKVHIFISKENLKDHVMELAQTFETKIPSWLPKSILLADDVDVILQR